MSILIILSEKILRMMDGMNMIHRIDRMLRLPSTAHITVKVLLNGSDQGNFGAFAYSLGNEVRASSISHSKQIGFAGRPHRGRSVFGRSV